ncbi:MAG: hypothetical protein NVS4B1_36560 [Ktedonobacteraceae bacterium]
MLDRQRIDELIARVDDLLTDAKIYREIETDARIEPLGQMYAGAQLERCVNEADSLCNLLEYDTQLRKGG